jgi:hypothetical protein
MATLLDLVQQLRLRLDDTGGDTGTPPTGYTFYHEYDDSGCLWGNAELTRLLNEAETEFCRRVPICDATTFRVQTVPGTAVYELDPVILAVERVYSATQQRALRKTFHEANDQCPAFFTATRYQESLHDHHLMILGTPTTVETLQLTVRRLPLEPLLWADRKTQEPEILAPWHYALIDYAAHLAWLKNDADTLSLERSVAALQVFDRLVGQPRSAQELAWVKTLSNRRPRAVPQYL